MTDKEKKIISLIAQDGESGKNYFRTDNEWEKIGIDRSEYFDYIRLINNFPVKIRDYDKDEQLRQLKLFVYFLSCIDYDFNEFLKEIANEKGKNG